MQKYQNLYLSCSSWGMVKTRDKHNICQHFHLSCIKNLSGQLDKSNCYTLILLRLLLFLLVYTLLWTKYLQGQDHSQHHIKIPKQRIQWRSLTSSCAKSNVLTSPATLSLCDYRSIDEGFQFEARLGHKCSKVGFWYTYDSILVILIAWLFSV